MIEEDVPYRPLGSARGQGEAGALPIANKRLALVTGGHRRLGGIIAGALARAGHSLAIHGSHDTRLDSHLALTLEEDAVGRLCRRFRRPRKCRGTDRTGRGALWPPARHPRQ